MARAIVSEEREYETMKRVIVAAFFALIPSLAFADNMPPPEYDSGPFKKPPHLYLLPEKELMDKCNGYSRANGRAENIACTKLTPTECSVYVNKVLPDGWFPGVWRHELGHCRGWPASHPDMR